MSEHDGSFFGVRGHPSRPERGLGEAEGRVDSRQSDRLPPSWTDPTVRRASALIGGPWGRHGQIGRRWFWTPLRVVLLLATLTLALAWWQKSPCQDGNWNLSKPVLHHLPDRSTEQAYVSGKQYVQLCYSDIIPLYGAEGIADHKVPYAQHVNEYPVLTGWFMYGAGGLGRGYDWLARQATFLPNVPAVESYYQATVLLLVISALIIVGSVARMHRRRPWDAAMVAVAPVIFAQAFTNWDLFAGAFAIGGIFAWSRRKHALGGVLIGLGTAAKLYPLFLLGPLLVLCFRARKLREFSITLVTAVISWAAVNVPVALLYRKNWEQFFTLNNTRPADPDTLWNVAQDMFDVQIPVHPLNLVTALLFGAICVGLAALALLAPRRPRLAQLAFLVVAGFLLTNKVWSPQYSIWLVPLAVLARPRWRLFLAWQFVDAFLWFPRMYWFLQGMQSQQKADGFDVLQRALDLKWFLIVVVVRDLLVLAYAVMVVRDVLRTAGDVVRADGVDDDPCGGVLDHAPDHGAVSARRGARVDREPDTGDDGWRRGDEWAPARG